MDETIAKYYEFDLNELDLTKYLIKPHFDFLASNLTKLSDDRKYAPRKYA